MNRRQRRFLWRSAGVLLMIVLTLVDRDEAVADWKMVPSASISISAKYDDNVTSQKTGIKDIVSVPIPSLGLSFERDVTKIQTGVSVRGELFGKNSDLNFTSYSGFANISHQINPINSVRFGDSVSYSSETLETVDTVQNEEGNVDSLITVQRGARINNRGSVSWSHQFSVLTAATVRYGNSLSFFKDPTQIDSTTHSADFGLSHQLDRSTTVSGNFSYSYFVIQGGMDSQNNNLSFGLARSLSASWKISGNVGLNYTIQPDQRTATMAGGLNLSKTISDQLAMSMGYSANVSPGGGVSGDVVRNQVVNLNLSQIFTRWLTGSASVRLGDSRSIASNQVQIFSWNAVAGLNYRLSQRITMGARYSHQQQISQGVLGSDFSRNQYSLSLSAALL